MVLSKNCGNVLPAQSLALPWHCPTAPQVPALLPLLSSALALLEGENTAWKWRGKGCTLLLETDSKMHKKSTKLHLLDIKKIFFTVRMVRLWNSLPNKVVDTPCLSVLKNHMDKTLICML